MRWLTAGLTFVNVATLSALLLGLALGGLSRGSAVISLLIALVLGLLAYWQTSDERTIDPVPGRSIPLSRLCFWFLAGCFAFFAFRSFCWLLFSDGAQLKVQSPNNLGDLALHLTYIQNFASGVPLWPDNPIHAFSKVRYPAGTDMFNSLLVLAGIDLTKGLIWAGLAGSFATFFALYKWGGSFTVAGFLFNGGLAGFQIVERWKLLDYQGDKTIAWKSLPLSMLVTQRGLLYALPAGLLLLYQWRARYSMQEARRGPKESASSVPLPFWIELTLYASMPLFHLHTFLALSLVAAFLFLVGKAENRKQLGLLVGSAVLPASLLVWMITNHFQAKSLLSWHPGWVQNVGEFAAPFFRFWFVNFGVLIPLGMVLVGISIWRRQRGHTIDKSAAKQALAFLVPAVLLFLFACLVKTAPWEWDNIKLIIWAYLIMLPFLWTQLIVRWPMPARVAVCAALFASGFVSLFGGLLSRENGYVLAERSEVDGVGSAVLRLPATARFAAYPTYNHPLLLQGRKVVLGYPGHLWTQGFEYAEIERRLSSLMLGAPDWREQARFLGVRYIFWGREEKNNYAASTRPWEREGLTTLSGTWGAIYDLAP